MKGLSVERKWSWTRPFTFFFLRSFSVFSECLWNTVRSHLHVFKDPPRLKPPLSFLRSIYSPSLCPIRVWTVCSSAQTLSVHPLHKGRTKPLCLKLSLYGLPITLFFQLFTLLQKPASDVETPFPRFCIFLIVTLNVSVTVRFWLDFAETVPKSGSEQVLTGLCSTAPEPGSCLWRSVLIQCLCFFLSEIYSFIFCHCPGCIWDLRYNFIVLPPFGKSSLGQTLVQTDPCGPDCDFIKVCSSGGAGLSETWSRFNPSGLIKHLIYHCD